MPNRFNPEIPPAWHAVRLDETHFYGKMFLDEFGVEKIYGVYVVDFSKRVHCCEITPSYELNFVNSVFDGGPDDDERLEELVQKLYEADACTDNVLYMHCNAVNALPEGCKHPIQIDEDEWGDTPENDGFDAAYEECQSNPVW